MTPHDSLRLLRAAHLIAARMQHPVVTSVRTVTGFMRYSDHVAKSFYLDEALHRRACELALAYGEAELARQLCELEMQADSK